MDRSEGDTTLYVNLRCMHIENKKATLYAGGGILPIPQLMQNGKKHSKK